MKKIISCLLRPVYIGIFLLFLLSIPVLLQAQCAMCTLNAEQSVEHGNTQGKGLNDGILFLLTIPYLAIALLGYVWYKHYRRKENEDKAPSKQNPVYPIK